jgi:hypothetical protein
MLNCVEARDSSNFVSACTVVLRLCCFLFLCAAFLSLCLDLIPPVPFRCSSCSAFAAGRSPGAVPKKLNLFFSAPHEVFASNQSVDAVYLPSREGVLGVMPGASFPPRVRIHSS